MLITFCKIGIFFIRKKWRNLIWFINIGKTITSFLWISLISPALNSSLTHCDFIELGDNTIPIYEDLIIPELILSIMESPTLMSHLSYQTSIPKSIRSFANFSTKYLSLLECQIKILLEVIFTPIQLLNKYKPFQNSLDRLY